MRSSLREQIAKVRENFDEHLMAINENSSEIQGLFDYLHDIEVKIDKLNARLDQVHLQQGVIDHNIVPLNEVEKQIFLVMYTNEFSMAFKEISEKAKVPLTLVKEYISSLSQKGIPIIRSYVNKQILVQLDPLFKEKQAKENVVNLTLETFF